MDLRRFWDTLRSRWKFSVATFVLGTLATAFLAFGAAPQYGATSKLFISTALGDHADFLGPISAGQQASSYVELVHEPLLIQGVIDRLHLRLSLSQVQGMIHSELIPSTQTIQIDVKAPTAGLAQQIAAAEAQGLTGLVSRLEKPAVESAQPAFRATVVGESGLNPTPVGPNIPKDLLVGVLLSLLVGLGGSLFRGMLDRTVRSRAEIERITGTTVMATLPRERKGRQQPLDGPARETMADTFRVLRTNLQFANLDAKSASILITSGLPDVSTPSVAMNLALSVAQAGHSVLLVDANLRNPGVATLLGMDNSVGLMSTLDGQVSVKQATQIHESGVDVLLTGPLVPNPAEVLETRAMRDLLARLRAAYDSVIISAPPILPYVDASILGQAVDGVLLLVRPGSVTDEQLRTAASRITDPGGRILAAVLTDVPSRRGELRAIEPSNRGKAARSATAFAALNVPASNRSRTSSRMLRSLIPPFVTVAILALLLPTSLSSGLGAVLALAVAALLIMLVVLGIELSAIAMLTISFVLAPMNDVRPVASLDFVTASDVFLVAGIGLLFPILIGRGFQSQVLFLLGSSGVIAFGLVSSAISVDPSASLNGLMRLVVGALLLPIIFLLWRPHRHVVLALASAYVVGNSISVASAAIGGTASYEGRYLGLTRHPNILGLCSMLALALIPFVLQELPKRWGWFVLTAAGICAYGVWISGSRAALLVTVVMIVVYILLARSVEQALLLFGLSIVPLYIVGNKISSGDVGNNILGRLLGGGSATASDQARQLLANQAVDKFLSHPIFGVGFGDVLQSHNIYLQVAGAVGVVGLVFYVVLLMSVIWQPFTLTNRYQLLALPALSYAMIGFITPLLWDRYIWCVLALPLLISRSAKAPPTNAHSPAIKTPQETS